MDRLNKGMGAAFEFDKDLVMRACLVIPDLPAGYKVSNFTMQNMTVIRENWDLIGKSLEGAVALAARFGLNGSQLTSKNAIIPIAYYLSKLQGHPLDGSSSFEIVNRERIRRWLFSSLVNGAFGGNSDQTIGVCRDTINEEMRRSTDFPLVKLVEDMGTRRSRNLAFDEQSMATLLDTRYGNKLKQVALGTVYDGRRWRGSRYHVDHMIAPASVTVKALRARGVPDDLVDPIRKAADRLGNLLLLDERESLQRADTDLVEWLRNRDEDFMERHFIPDEPRLWQPEALLDLIDAREELMRAALERFLILEDDASGPVFQIAA